MSKQVNFFTAEADMRVLHGNLLQRWPDLRALFADDRPEQPQIPAPAKDVLPTTDRTLCLIPPWAERLLVQRKLADGRFVADSWTSPVLEYAPCRIADAGREITVGRLYWGFRGQIQEARAKEVDSLLAWVRRRTKPYPDDTRFRLFPGACAPGTRLNFRFGIVHEAPPW